MRAAPTAVELAQYVDALNEGIDAELARTTVWPAYRATVILSLVDQNELTPLVIGWDTCSRCERQINGCTCAGGPTEPSYVRAWRQIKPGAANAARAVSTPVETDPVDELENTEKYAELRSMGLNHEQALNHIAESVTHG